jgi:CRISPR-associated exonuclease Cas4
MGALLKFLEIGLRNTDSGLGDRSKYIGSSDIGQCPKKSYLSKTVGETHELKQLLIFERGHVAEGIVRNGLTNNPSKIPFKEQVEVSGMTSNTKFIKTHIDFVVEFPNEYVVVECKTISSSLPKGTPRESWIYQVQLQLGLLKQRSKKQVRGLIVAFDLNLGDAFEFDVEFNETLYDVAIQRADRLWQAVQSQSEPKGETGDLCGYCNFSQRCNTLQSNGGKMPEEVEAIATKVKELSSLEKEIKANKQNLKAFMEAANCKKVVGKNITLSMINRKGAAKVSLDELKKKYPEVAKNVTVDSQGYSYIKVI